MDKLESLLKKLGKFESVKSYHSNKANKSHELVEAVSKLQYSSVVNKVKLPIEAVKGKHVVIICETLRAGATIPTFHVAAVFERISKNGVAVVQSLVGRCCGNDKVDDNFPIYTSIDAVEAYAKMESSGFAEVWTEGGNFLKNSRGRDSYTDKKLFIVGNDMPDVKNKAELLGFTLNKNQGNSGQGFSTSTYKSQDIARSIVECLAVRGKANGGGVDGKEHSGTSGEEVIHYGMYYVNGECADYGDSYKRLREFKIPCLASGKEYDYPSFEGKTILTIRFKKTDDAVKGENSDRCAFSTKS